jgi:GntR family transcriptional regulator
MFIRVESSSGVPIVRQVADQIRAQAATGGLMPGDKLPSVRQLARELLVNQNTVLRVYERLTAEGLLEMRHGDGTYLAAVPKNSAKLQRVQLEEDVRRIAHRAIDLGIEAGEIHEMVDDALARGRRERATARKGEQS